MLSVNDLRAAQAANPEAYEQLRSLAMADTDVAGGTDPSKFGDGKILEWLKKYGPGILQMILMIFGLPPIVIPPIPPTPGPVG